MIATALKGKTRWILLGLLVVLGVYLLFFTPVRTYIDQRGQMQAAQNRYEALSSTNGELRQRAEYLQTDAAIRQRARDYELVAPGQQAYAVMPPQAPPAPAAVPKRSDGLWDKINFLN